MFRCARSAAGRPAALATAAERAESADDSLIETSAAAAITTPTQIPAATSEAPDLRNRLKIFCMWWDAKPPAGRRFPRSAARTFGVTTAYPRSARAVRSRAGAVLVLLSDDIELLLVALGLVELGELLLMLPVESRPIPEPVVFAALPLGAGCVFVLGPAVSFAPAGLVLLAVSLMFPELVEGLVLVWA
jgi:hypothetical protein